MSLNVMAHNALDHNVSWIQQDLFFQFAISGLTGPKVDVLNARFPQRMTEAPWFNNASIGKGNNLVMYFFLLDLFR